MESIVASHVELVCNAESDDSTTISPPRKQAYHLFGTVPVWDDAVQTEIVGLKVDETSSKQKINFFKGSKSFTFSIYQGEIFCDSFRLFFGNKSTYSW